MTRIFGLIFLLACTIFLSCKQRPTSSTKQAVSPLPIDTSIAIKTIAFGSCNKQYEPQPLWSSIIKNHPDLWIWLGDNIYGDTKDMQVLKEKYLLQNSNPEYQKLLSQCPIIGTWDDHDYGVNNGGKEYPKKAESKQLFTEFMGYANDHPIHQHEGVYHSISIGTGEEQVKFIMLDSRYFRDPIVMQNSVYVPNDEGTILGEEQWKWLEGELKESKAKVHIIGNGIQVIPEEHRFEKWANFPHERQRLFDLLDSLEVKNPILISGDRHAAEISAYPLASGKQLIEVTASGLTHAYTSGGIEPNQYRIGIDRVRTLNFGLIRFDWLAQEVFFEIRGKENELFAQHKSKID